jgi:hypothetical protein
MAASSSDALPASSPFGLAPPATMEQFQAMLAATLAAERARSEEQLAASEARNQELLRRFEQNDAKRQRKTDELTSEVRRLSDQLRQVRDREVQNDNPPPPAGQPQEPMDGDADDADDDGGQPPPEDEDAPHPQLEEWITKANLQMANLPHKSYYTNWTLGLSQDDVKRVFQILNNFKDSVPQNPTIMYAPERAGKSGAMLSVIKAAQIAGTPVIIFCAPAKVAPVTDMVEKLYKGGFHDETYGCNIAHTLSKSAKRPSQFNAFVLVCALCSPADQEKASEFITAHAMDRRKVVVIADECDEIVMGKGRSRATVDHRNNPDNYKDYLPRDDGEDGNTSPDDSDDSDDTDDAERGVVGPNAPPKSYDVANARKIFQEKVVPHVHLFMVTATVSGILVDPLSVFRSDLETQVLLVRMNRNYYGIENFVIPAGCKDFHEGLMTTNPDTGIFQENHGNFNLLNKFIAHENPHDGHRLVHAVEQNDVIEIKGAAYITITNRVNAAGGIADLSWDLHQHMRKVHPEFQHTTLIFSFVGTPTCRLGNNGLHAFNRGMTFEEMYNEMAKEYKQGICRIDGVDRKRVCFTDAITHIVLLGFTLTRRAMTAAFRPADKPKTLVAPMYVIARSGRASKVDADSQRVMRAGGDLGEYILPDGFEVWISCDPELLENLKKLRRMEEESLREQGRNTKLHAEFLHTYSGHTHGIAHLKLTKRGVSMQGIGHGTREFTLTLAVSKAIEKFVEFLTNEDGLSATTVNKYRGIAEKMTRQVYVDGDDPRQIRLSEIVTFDELEDFIRCPHVVEYGEYYDSKKAPFQRTIAAVFGYLKSFSLTDEGANAITDAEQA